jgi:hypothetical protein
MIPKTYPISIEENTRFLDEKFAGHLVLRTTAPGTGAFSSGSPVTFTAGTSRILFVIKTANDAVGTMTVSGDTRDRTDTSVLNAADSEDISVTGLSTDNSAVISVESQPHTKHEFVKCYMTDKWFDGSISVSTTDLDILTMDVYQISYRQFNDSPSSTLKGFDVMTEVLNANAWFYAYLYAIVNQTGKEYNLSALISHVINTPSVVDASYRRRKAINQTLNTTTDGVWVELHFGPDTFSYFINFTAFVEVVIPTPVFFP